MEIKTNEDIHANVKGIFNKYYCVVLKWIAENGDDVEEFRARMPKQHWDYIYSVPVETFRVTVYLNNGYEVGIGVVANLDEVGKCKFKPFFEYIDLRADIFQIKSGLVITPEDFIGKLNEIKSWRED